MFHRLVAGLFILVLAVFIHACAGNKTSTPRGQTAESAASTPTDAAAISEEEQSIAAAAALEPPSGLKNFVETDIYFDKGSAALSPQAKGELVDKAQWLTENPDIRVVIQGHSDEPGTAEYNFALGDRRAGTVKSYLIGLGIPPARLAVVSYGKEQPAAAGDPGRNRRVHFEIETLD